MQIYVYAATPEGIMDELLRKFELSTSLAQFLTLLKVS